VDMSEGVRKGDVVDEVEKCILGPMATMRRREKTGNEAAEKGSNQGGM